MIPDEPDVLWHILRLLSVPNLFGARAVCRGWATLLDVTATSAWWRDRLALELGLVAPLTAEQLAPGCAPRAVIRELFGFRQLMKLKIGVTSKNPATGPSEAQVWQMLKGWEDLVMLVALQVRVPFRRWLQIPDRALAYFVVYVASTYKDVVEKEDIAAWWSKAAVRIATALGDVGKDQTAEQRAHIAETFRVFVRTMVRAVMHPLHASDYNLRGVGRHECRKLAATLQVSDLTPWPDDDKP